MAAALLIRVFRADVHVATFAPNTPAEDILNAPALLPAAAAASSPYSLAQRGAASPALAVNYTKGPVHAGDYDVVDRVAAPVKGAASMSAKPAGPCKNLQSDLLLVLRKKDASATIADECPFCQAAIHCHELTAPGAGGAAAASAAHEFSRLSLHSLPPSPARPPALMDGVKLHGKDPLLLPREDLRHHILQLLGAHRCVFITAPPGAGKSSVIQLLELQLEKHSRVLIVKAVELHKGMHPEVWLVQHARTALQQMKDAVPDVQTLTAAINAFDYIFIDDAQRTFSYPDFWQALIKSNGRAHIAFFASYSIETADTATPSVPAKVTWSGFRLSDTEQQDLADRFLQLPYYANQRTWLAQVVPMLRQDSAGHVGIFRLLLQRLLDEFPATPERPASVGSVCAFYFGRLFEQQVAERFFSFPHDFFSRYMKFHEVLEQVLLGQVPTPPVLRISSATPDASSLASAPVAAASSAALPDASILRALMRIPLLVDDGGYLAFATPMHRRFFHRLAFPSALHELPSSINIDQWLLLVLRTFQPHLLADVQSGFKEGMLQHEFWRGASLCLPPTHRVAAEVSRVLKQGTPRIAGELDFWINSTLEWAIELLRQGDRKGEHLERFKRKGVYGPLRAKQWRVVDFRLAADPKASLPRPRSQPGYVSVVMRSVACRDADVTFPAVTFPDGRTRPQRELQIRFTGSHSADWRPDTDDAFQQLA